MSHRRHEPAQTERGDKKETPYSAHARGENQGKSFAKACDRWRGQPSHSELNNVNERGRNFMPSLQKIVSYVVKARQQKGRCVRAVVSDAFRTGGERHRRKGSPAMNRKMRR